MLDVHANIRDCVKQGKMRDFPHDCGTIDTFVYWCRSSPFLELPEPDLRPEQMILSSDEAMVDLRKRDRDALVRNLAARKKQVGRCVCNQLT